MLGQSRTLSADLVFAWRLQEDGIESPVVLESLHAHAARCFRTASYELTGRSSVHFQGDWALSGLVLLPNMAIGSIQCFAYSPFILGPIAIDARRILQRVLEGLGIKAHFVARGSRGRRFHGNQGGVSSVAQGISTRRRFKGILRLDYNSASVPESGVRQRLHLRGTDMVIIPSHRLPLGHGLVLVVLYGRHLGREAWLLMLMIGRARWKLKVEPSK